jgi:ribosome-associated toxin RatA of RatAB toxin-antitoxin module
MNPGEGTAATAIVEASLNEVFESLVSIDQYPTWLTAIKSAKVIESDDSGRPSKVELKIDAGMLKDRVTLDYDWSAAPEKISFSLDEADLMTRMDGEYVLKSLGDETQVSYQLFVEVSLPVPRMMIAKGEEATAKQALKELADKFA